jgi:cyclopropane fatty-acyl-phospholipid synthase-like methyltransferase
VLTKTPDSRFYLASQLAVKKGDRVLDVGCGIGGPMRNIAKFTHARVTGITLNEYQVTRLSIGCPTFVCSFVLPVAN